MPPVGFEPTISAGERPQTYALDRAATGTGLRCNLDTLIYHATFPESKDKGNVVSSARQEGIWRSGVMAPLILNFNSRTEW